MFLAPQQLGTFEPLMTVLSPPSPSSASSSSSSASSLIKNAQGDEIQQQQQQQQQQIDRFVVLEDFVSLSAAPTCSRIPPPPVQQASKNDGVATNENRGNNTSSDALWIPRPAQQQQEHQQQPLLLPFQQGWDIQKELSLEHRHRLDRLRFLQQQTVGPASTTEETLLLSPFLDKKTAAEWLRQQEQEQRRSPVAMETMTMKQQQPQQPLAARDDVIVRGGRDTILFVQHEPVYTLGSGSDESFILNNANSNTNEIPIVRMNRGGEVTYHGPGMLVVYPVLDLRNYRQDIHWYMRALEEAVLLALQDVGIQSAVRDEETTGVWIRDDTTTTSNGKDDKDNNMYKVAAIGVNCRQWITQHGLAINVERIPSLERAFEGIIPCGLHGRKVGCVNQFLDEKHAITVEEMAKSMVAALEEVFRIKLVKRPFLY
jgi:lipoyl(octanoyl) transferase